jgi:NAD(P)-dependent dehydrogenase (short-subunit alcohol dehydrogenase family)
VTVETQDERRSALRRLEGKVAVVTGSASGIGQAFARRLAQDGADVVLVDVKRADETARMVRDAERDALVVECDLRDPEQIASMAGAARERFERVDILVNNAGVYPIKEFLSMSFEEWRAIFSLNIDALFHTCQAFLPGMRDNGSGRVINMASGTFHHGSEGFSHYAASKGAVIGFTRCLASEVGQYGITVNAIGPGLVATETTRSGPQADGMFEALAAQQAIKRTEVPDDLVGALSFLVSDDGAFVTGQTMMVDGGFVKL